MSLSCQEMTSLIAWQALKGVWTFKIFIVQFFDCMYTLSGYVDNFV